MRVHGFHPGGRRFGAAFESAEKENEVIRQIKVYIQDHIETKLSREEVGEAVICLLGI